MGEAVGEAERRYGSESSSADAAGEVDRAGTMVGASE